MMDIDQLEVVDWRTPINMYLEMGELPENRADARRLRRQAAYYLLRNGVLYKRDYSLPLLTYVSSTKAKYIFGEVYEGDCGDHLASRAIANKILCQGYYWPTMGKDSNRFAMCYSRC